MCISKPISFKRKELSTQVTRAEFELAVCVCCHGAIETVDDLSEILVPNEVGHRCQRLPYIKLSVLHKLKKWWHPVFVNSW